MEKKKQREENRVVMEKKKQREKNRTITIEQKASTPHSKSSEEKGKETSELEQKYMKLEQDWNAFKESRSTTSCKYRSLSLSNKPSCTIQQIINNNNIVVSPRELMSNLQRDFSSLSEEEEEEEEEIWKNYDMTAREIFKERRKNIDRGKLKGRRLFQNESESDNDNNMSQQGEIKSMNFCYLKNEHEFNGSKWVHGDFVDKDMVATVEDNTRVGSYITRFFKGTRYGVFLGGFVFVSVMVAMSMSLGISFGGHDYDFDDILVPT